MSPVRKMAENGRLTVDQKVKVVLFCAETKSVVATQRRFRAHFVTRWAPCKQTIYRLSLGTIFQPMRINSVPDVKCFCNNKNFYVYSQWYDISCATLYYCPELTINLFVCKSSKECIGMLERPEKKRTNGLIVSDTLILKRSDL